MIDVLITILCCVVVLSVLVFIHEGGHFLAARAFGVRVTEFFLGLPGPGISFKKNGTRFGVTCIPLGGYARICGMEPGNLQPHLKDSLTFVYRHGTVTNSNLAHHLHVSLETAENILLQLVD